MIEQLGIIGCGLMGCSFALASKKAGIVKRVVGYSKSPTTTTSAIAAGILDEAASSALQAVAGSDVVLIAVPVGAVPKIFTDIASLVSPDTLVMDVGSTKRDVVEAARKYFRTRLSSFVPTHPITGDNLSGFQAAKADLYDSTRVILTPLKETKPELVRKATAIWEAIGAQTLMMGEGEHDRAFGMVSHFPHLLAFVYMSYLLDLPDGTRYLPLAGQGFKDFSRIAGSEPTLWHDVFMANRLEMRAQISAFKRVLQRYDELLQQENSAELTDLLKHASAKRTSWVIGEQPNLIQPEDEAPEPEVKLGFWSRLLSK